MGLTTYLLETDMTNIEQRIDLTFSKLGLREPFIAAVMVRVKRIYDDPRVTTGATDGTSIFYNREFAEKQNDEELFGLTLHEALHIILVHPWRREGRDPQLWNIANDAIINHYIRSRGYSLPEGGVYLSWVTESMSSEEVYARLKQEQQEQQDSGSGDGGGSGDDAEGDGKPSGGFDDKGDLFDAVDENARTDMEATIQAAAKMAKECGQGSSLIDRVLGRDAKPRVHWRDVTRAMMTESCPADYTFARVNRRFIANNIYLPSLHSEALGGLAIGFDTSGSMTQDDCDQIAAEINAIVSDLNPAFVEVIYCDSDVAGIERFEMGECIDLHPKGGGGTRFKPVFDHVIGTGDNYCGLIYFTDMYGNLTELVEPPFPVIWANTYASSQAISEPFGTQVEVYLK